MAQTIVLRGDPISPLTGLVRKYRTLVKVARQRRLTVTSEGEFVARVSEICRTALAAPSPNQMIQALWGIESLAFSFFGNRADPSPLAEMRLPPAAGVPAHCGMTMAVVMATDFIPEQLLERIEGAAEPQFLDFCHETVGLMLAAYEGGLFGSALGLCGRLGLLRCRPLSRPRTATFARAFSDHQRRLLAHGYGRLLYFKELDLLRALSRAATVRGLAHEACITGAVSAYTLINSRNLDRLLGLRQDEGIGQLTGDAIERGLCNALLLLAWTKPGSLDALKPGSERGTRLISEAKQRAATARAQGEGPPMSA